MRTTTCVKLRPDLAASFDAIPDSENGRSKTWTPEADSIVLKYWKVKKQHDFIRIFEQKFFRVKRLALDKRWHELTDNNVSK